MTWSLRARLLVGIIGGSVLLLAIFSLAVYAAIRGALLRQYDKSLASIAHVLAASVELDGNDVELEFEVQQMPEFQDAERPTHYQLWDDKGTVAAKSPLLGERNLRLADAVLNSLVFLNSQEIGGQPQRAVVLKFTPRIADSEDAPDNSQSDSQSDEQAFTLAVARGTGELERQLQLLRRLLLAASAAVVTLSFVCAAVVARHGLRPLNSIASEIAAINEENLAARVGARPVPAELAPIKNRLNELLSRLETSFARERKFNADVAHELRTPLAGMRSTIEVALARNRDSSEYREALAECLQIAGGMQAVVGNLLMLTRLDAGQTDLNSEAIPLAELVNSSWRPFSDRALDRGITFDNGVGPDVTLQSDRASLTTVLSNVLGNAVEYADDGGRIWVTARHADDSIEIAVSNTGCHLAAEQVSQVFNCFWRADPSRSDTGAHFGLGLALVRRLAETLGGRADAATDSGGIFTIRLNFPVGP